MPFDPQQSQLLDEPAFATLALTLPSGSLQSTVMWYLRDGDRLLMIAPANSVKARALRTSPIVAVTVIDPKNFYRYVEIRGNAMLIDDDQRARQTLVSIAQRYIGDKAAAYAASLSADPRVLIAIEPTRVRLNAGSSPEPRG